MLKRVYHGKISFKDEIKPHRELLSFICYFMACPMPHTFCFITKQHCHKNIEAAQNALRCSLVILFLQ